MEGCSSMKVWNFFPRFASLMLLLTACFLALRDGMKLEWWGIGEIALICGGTALFITGIYSHRIAAGAGVAVTLALEIWMCFFCGEQLEQELWRCYCHVIPQVNEYYRTAFAAGEVAARGDSRYFLLFLSLLLGMWLGSGLTGEKMGRGRKISSFLPLIPAFLVGLLLGNGPRIGAVACLVLGIWARLFLQDGTQTRTQRQAKLLGAGGMGIMIVVSAVIYRPVSEKLLQHHDFLRAFQLSLEDKGLALMEESSFFGKLLWKMGGYQQTARLTMDPPGLGEDVVLEITVSQLPKTSMYLKNFIGTYYDSGIWYCKDEQRFDDLARQQGLTPEEYGRKIQTIFYETLHPKQEPDSIQIRILKHTGNLSPLPYFSDLPKEAKVIGDDGVRVTAGDSYQVQGYCNPDGTVFYEMTENGYALRKDLYQDQPYLSYASDLYFCLPQGQLQKLRSRFEEAVQSLADSRYSFQLDPVPPKEDIVENFLFVQKKGYCMHFASAAVLLMRIAHEIPSRYVSGYLVLPQDFTENEDGTYTARVSEQRAHAWMEIFREGFGWSPVEVTPGSYVEALQENPGASVREAVARQDASPLLRQEQQQMQEELERQRQEAWEQQNGRPEQPEQGADDKEGQKEEGKNPEEAGSGQDFEEAGSGQNPEEAGSQESRNPGEKEAGQEAGQGQNGKKGHTPLPVFLQILLWILTGILLLAGFFLLNLWRIAAIRKRRRRRFEGENRQAAAEALIRQSFRLLELLGIFPEEEEGELEFAERVEGQLSCFGEHEFTAFIEIARQVRYGSREVEEGQRERLYGIYRKLTGELWGQFKWYRKALHCWGTGILELKLK